MVSSAKIRAQASVVAGNDSTTSASLFLGVDTVFNTETSGLDSIVKDSSILVIASATEVDDTVRREDVLSTSSTVLCSASSNQLGIVVV